MMITTFMVPATMLLLGAGLLLGSGTDFSTITGK
jgi:tight adherence protein C